MNRYTLLALVFPILVGCDTLGLGGRPELVIDITNQTDIVDCAVDIFKVGRNEGQIASALPPGHGIRREFDLPSGRERDTITLIARPTRSFDECVGSDTEDFRIRADDFDHDSWRIRIRGRFSKTSH